MFIYTVLFSNWMVKSCEKHTYAFSCLGGLASLTVSCWACLYLSAQYMEYLKADLDLPECNMVLSQVSVTQVDVRVVSGLKASQQVWMCLNVILKKVSYTQTNCNNNSKGWTKIRNIKWMFVIHSKEMRCSSVISFYFRSNKCINVNKKDVYFVDYK